MKHILRRIPFAFSALLLLLPFTVGAVGVDIGFAGGTQDIFFSKEKLVAGEPVRIYARVHNFSNTDIIAQVAFYQGSALIGEPQPVSLRANGLSDEVFVDWTVPQSSFNIVAEVKGQNPRDENPSNDIVLTPLLTPEPPAPPPPASTAGLATSVGAGNVQNPQKKEETKTSTPKASAVKTAPTASVSSAQAPAPKAASALTNPATPAVAPLYEAPLNDLLKVYVDTRQTAWNTFQFIVDSNRAGDISYEWSFGDGKTARGKDVTHSYFFAGRYVASVVAVEPMGERAQTKMTLDISFWNLGNWQLWAVLAVLGGFVTLLLAMTRKEKEAPHHVDRSAVEEGDMPPVLLQEEERENAAIATAPVKKKRKPPVRKKKTPPLEETDSASTEEPSPEVVDDETSE
ncbi:PKD domain-containing protein [Candidatus Uhrbacteria bacterium]|nr:PKD domain-containing protein [Candidatus Uhrbacteria bacterium]